MTTSRFDTSPLRRALVLALSLALMSAISVRVEAKDILIAAGDYYTCAWVKHPWPSVGASTRAASCDGKIVAVGSASDGTSGGAGLVRALP